MENPVSPELVANTIDNAKLDDAQGLSLSVWVFAAIFIGILTSAGMLVSYGLYGNINSYYSLLSLFLSINLLICLWEICLYLRGDYIAERHHYWQERYKLTGKTPAVEFLQSRVNIDNVLSATFWADVWSTYSLYDGSYADKRTFGFNADVGNGFFSLIPTLIFHVGITISVFEPVVLGILGVMIFWVWTYNTTLYFVSFFLVGRHRLISLKDNLLYIAGTNAPWILFSLLGIYVSIRLILDNSYSVLGH